MADGVTYQSKNEAIKARDDYHYQGYDATIKRQSDGSYKVYRGEKLMYTGAGGNVGIGEIFNREKQEKEERNYGYGPSIGDEKIEEDDSPTPKEGRRDSASEKRAQERYEKEQKLGGLRYPKHMTAVDGTIYVANNEEEETIAIREIQRIKALDESGEIKRSKPLFKENKKVKGVANILMLEQQGKYVKGAVEHMNVGSVRGGMKRAVPSVSGNHPKIGSTPEGMISDANKPRIANETGMPKIAQTGYTAGDRIKAYPYFKNKDEVEGDR